MIQLHISYETIDINLQANGYTVLDGFYPQTATNLDQHVTDEIEIMMQSGASDIRSDLLRALNRAFEHARQHPLDPDPVWLEFAVDGASALWRARIYNGSVMLDNTMDRRWRRNQIRAKLLVEREPTWEGPLAQIPLTNPNGADNLTGLTVYNCSDGSGTAPNQRVNWVEVDGDDIEGDLPADTRLEIVNTFNSSWRSGTFWVTAGAENVQNLTHIIEGESSTIGTTVTVDGYSGGKVQEVSWSGTSETKLYSWDLSTQALNAYAGNYFRTILVFSSLSYYDLWLRARIKMSLTTLWESPSVLMRNGLRLQEFISLRLPPYLVGAGDLYPLTLELYAKRNVNESHGLSIDFMQLSPLDGWRRLNPVGYNLAYQTRLVDDGTEGLLYTDGWTPAGKTGHYVGFGHAIQLQPGRRQRLYFLWTNDTGGGEAARTIAVKLFYRPRRMSL